MEMTCTRKSQQLSSRCCTKTCSAFCEGFAKQHSRKEILHCERRASQRFKLRIATCVPAHAASMLEHELRDRGCRFDKALRATARGKLEQASGVLPLVLQQRPFTAIERRLAGLPLPGLRVTVISGGQRLRRIQLAKELTDHRRRPRRHIQLSRGLRQ